MGHEESVGMYPYIKKLLLALVEMSWRQWCKSSDYVSLVSYITQWQTKTARQRMHGAKKHYTIPTYRVPNRRSQHDILSVAKIAQSC